MSTDGIPEEISTDNCSPYSAVRLLTTQIGWLPTSPGILPHWTQKVMAPQRSLLNLCIILVHTSLIEGKDPKKELSTYLLQYRSTPRMTASKLPAELLFGRRIQRKLPQFHPQKETKEIAEVRKHHDRNKLLQRAHSDKTQRSKLKMINEGDKVLIKQNKSTRRSSFDPKPFHVVKVKGSQLTMKREHQTRTRNKGHIRLIKERPLHLTPTWQQKALVPTSNYEDFDVDVNWTKVSGQAATNTGGYFQIRRSGGRGPHIKFGGKIWGKVRPSSPNKGKNLGRSVTTRRKSWEKVPILGSYLKFIGQNLGYLSFIFLEAKFGAPARISEAKFWAKPPLRPPDIEVPPWGYQLC